MSDVLDLSHHNDVTDFGVLRASGIVGIIHKATESDDYFDPTYAPRRVEAERAGLLWGAYHFMRPGDQAKQAKWFIDHAQPKSGDLICADYEDDNLTLQDLRTFLTALLDLTGHHAVIYSGHLIKEQVGSKHMADLARHQLWIAQYTSAPQPEWPTATWPEYFLWQFTDQGDAPGVSGNVDCNRSPLKEKDLEEAWDGSTRPERPAIPIPGPEHVVKITIVAPPGVHIIVDQVVA